MNTMNAPLAGLPVANDRETWNLIGSDKVDGTRVYGADSEPIGHIARLMIGKRDGQVAYAVLSFGGFLGMGKKYFPLPWSALTYDEKFGGYELRVTEDQLREAPSYVGDDAWNWTDRTLP